MEEIVRNQTSGVKPSLTQEQKKQKNATLQELGRRNFLFDDIERSSKRAVGADKATRVQYKSDAERKLDGIRYRLGDMVWAKVKSHPWWPGQLYDPNLASSSAMELKRDDCFLVAFFGDSTFGWFSESELIPFDPNFTSKSKQTTAPNFVDAVEDALDEVRRRVKLGLTCQCCTINKIPAMVEGKPGLLYDRQLSRIRKTFEPAKLLSFIKRLACAPLSSWDTLKSTLAGAQGDAIRLLVSMEHKEVDNLNDHAQSDEIMAQNYKAARMEKGKSHSIKAYATQKQQSKASLVLSASPGLEGVDRYKKKPRKLNSPDEGRSQPGSSVVHEVENTKKSHLENKKTLHGGEGNAKIIVPKGRWLKKKEGNALKSTSFLQEIPPLEGEGNAKKTVSMSKELKTKEGDASKSTSLSRGILSLDACEELRARDYSQRGESSGQIESCEGSDALDLVAEKNSAALQKPDLPTNYEKPHELMGNHESGADHGMEAPAVDLLARKPTKVKRLVKKVKVSMSEQGTAVKAKGTRKEDNTEGFDDSCSMKKKQKIGSVSVVKAIETMEDDNTEGFDDCYTPKKKQKTTSDSGVKAKGAMEDGNTEGDHSYTKTKKQNLLAGTEQMHNQGYTQGSVTLGSVSISIQQETERLSGEKIHQESGSKEPYVERVVSSSSADDAAAIPELVMQGEVIQEKQEFKVVGVSVLDVEQECNVVGVSVLDVEQGCELGSKPRVCSSEAECVVGVRKEEEENIKSTDTAIDVLKPEKVQVQSRGDNMENIVKGGEESTENILPDSIVGEDATSKGLDCSSSKAESGVCADTMPSSVTGVLKEGMSRKTKKPSLGKHLKEDKKSEVPCKEAQLHLVEGNKSKEPNKAKASRKRVLDESEHLSKDSSAITKKLKSSSAEIVCETLKSSEATDVAKLHKIVQGSARLHDLQEGAVAVSPKPIEAVGIDIEQSGQCLKVTGLGHGVDSVSDYGSGAVREQRQLGEEQCGNALEPESDKVEGVRHERENKKHEKIGAAAPKVAKKSVSFSKTLSSSSISLRPVFKGKSPLHGSRGVSNRFGIQHVARQAEEAERFKKRPHEGTLTIKADSFKNNLQEEGTLMIKFAKGFLMPSERQLRKVFCNFGDLNEPQTRINSERRCARVVFQRTQDAAAALSHMQESPFYENALFWLKSRESDVRGLAKQSSKLSPTLEKPFLSNNTKQSGKLSTLEKPFLPTTSTTEIKAASGTVRLGSTGKDRATDGRLDVAFSSHSRKEGDSAEADNPTYLQAKPVMKGTTRLGSSEKGDSAEADNTIYSQAKTVVNNPLLSTCSHAVEKAPAMDILASKAGIESIPTPSRNPHGCFKEATSRAGIIPTSSRNPHACLEEATSLPDLSRLGQGIPDSQAPIDISDRFTALLHQVHDIVESIGFVL